VVTISLLGLASLAPSQNAISDRVPTQTGFFVDGSRTITINGPDTVTTSGLKTAPYGYLTISAELTSATQDTIDKVVIQTSVANDSFAVTTDRNGSTSYSEVFGQLQGNSVTNRSVALPLADKARLVIYVSKTDTMTAKFNTIQTP